MLMEFLSSQIFFCVLLFTTFMNPPAVVFSNPTKACDFPAIFNFGDSNSDTGGLAAAFLQPGPPHGDTYFGRPAGRFSDGRVILDFIGNMHAFVHCFSSYFLYDLKNQKKRLWAIWCIVAWSIWVLRNNIVFREGTLEVVNLLELSQWRAWSWISSKARRFKSSMYEWLSNPCACIVQI